MRSIGDICRIIGMKNDTKMNGHLCEILTDLVKNIVPEADGVEREAMRYGIRIIGMVATGYVRPENLHLEISAHDRAYDVRRRAAFIHSTGWEERVDQRGEPEDQQQRAEVEAAKVGKIEAGGDFGGAGATGGWDAPVEPASEPETHSEPEAVSGSEPEAVSGSEPGAVSGE